MTPTTALLVAATTMAVVACAALDRLLKRRRQLAYLRGPLRQQLQYVMTSPALATPRRLQLAPTVTPLAPQALLTHQQLSA